MKRIASVVFYSLACGSLAFAQLDLQPAAIVKLTKSEPITVKMIKTEVQKIEVQAGRTLTVPERKQVLDVMINERLALQAADRDKVVITETELTNQLQQSRSVMAQSIGRNPTDAEFEAAVKSETGMDFPAFKEQLRRQLIVQKYLVTKKKSSFESIKPPTEAEIKDAYELSKAKLIRPDTVRFSMIFVPFEANADSKAKAKVLAEKLSKDIGSNPSKFDEAVIKAQAANSGYQAGDGGYLPRTPEAQQIVGTEFMNVVFALKQGQVSRLMENQKGFQIVKLTETYGQKTLELDDIYQLGSKVTVKEYIADLIFQQVQQKVLEAATEELVKELRTGTSFQVFESNLAW